MLVDFFMQQQKSEQYDEHRIAAEKHRDNGSGGVKDGELIENHADHNTNKAGYRKKGEISRAQPAFTFFKTSEGKRGQNERAYKKSQKGELNRVECVG